MIVVIRLGFSYLSQCLKWRTYLDIFMCFHNKINHLNFLEKKRELSEILSNSWNLRSIISLYPIGSHYNGLYVPFWLKTHIFANIFKLYIIVSPLILFLLSYPSITKQKTKAKQNKKHKQIKHKTPYPCTQQERKFWGLCLLFSSVPSDIQSLSHIKPSPGLQPYQTS